MHLQDAIYGKLTQRNKKLHTKTTNTKTTWCNINLKCKTNFKEVLFIATIKFKQCLLINTYYLHSNDYFAGRL